MVLLPTVGIVPPTSPPPPLPPTLTSTTTRNAISMHRQQPLEGLYCFLASQDHENQLSHTLCKNHELTFPILLQHRLV